MKKNEPNYRAVSALKNKEWRKNLKKPNSLISV